MSMQIGFFLHIPWPSSEIYRTLPWRKELLLGVLSSSLIGFQTHDYSRHFQSACTRIVGATCSNEVRPRMSVCPFTTHVSAGRVVERSRVPNRHLPRGHRAEPFHQGAGLQKRAGAKQSHFVLC
jgi:hypothetical protein